MYIQITRTKYDMFVGYTIITCGFINSCVNSNHIKMPLSILRQISARQTMTIATSSSAFNYNRLDLYTCIHVYVEIFLKFIFHRYRDNL